MENSFETEQDLQRLIGQYESIRLDFKASALLAQPKDRIIKQLTEEVSAFANTEGGIMVIGISEGKSGKKSVAMGIDEGVDPAQVSPEWLEQLIASNVSPPIPGLTVRPIPLSGPKLGRVAYVVSVPKGATAYQARHSLLYYGRTEFAAVPLHDNHIRLLMTRGRVAQAVVSILNCRVTSTSEGKLAQWEKEKDKWHAQHRDLPDAEKTMKALHSGLWPKPRFTSEYSFQTSLKNTAEVTIDDFSLSLSFIFDTDLTVKEGESYVKSGTEQRVRMPGERRSDRYTYPRERIFPGDQLVLCTWQVAVPHEKSLNDSNLRMKWAVYLEDSPPSSGELNVAAELSRLIAVGENSSGKTGA